VNQSTVRYIKSVEQRIREFVPWSSLETAKATFVPRDKDIVETEKALSLWVQDMRRRNEAIGRTAICKEA
jgi:hypothetical protein